ncbi:MAG: GNAT family N-acetyltransferase [Chitinophagaceae bacterium]
MNKLMNKVNNGDYVIHTDISKFDISAIHSFISTKSYWAKNIPFTIVEKSIQNSLCFGLFHQINSDNYHQIGLARVVTDYATFAYLCDVYIEELHRGKGLAKWLMQTVHNYAELQHIRRWLLVTKDAQDLYKQFDWQFITEDMLVKMMQKHNPNIYL